MIVKQVESIWGAVPHVTGVRAGYRGASLTRNSAHLGSYSRTMPRTL